MKKVTLLLLLVVWIASCKHDPFLFDENGGGITPPDTTQNPTGKPCDPDSVYFENDILPLILSNCATSGCHDATTQQDGVRLTDYNSIFSDGDVRPGDPDGSDLYEVLVETDPDKRMPYNRPPLPADQIALIEKWILQGAPNNSCDASCDTTNVSFQNDILAIIQKNCQSCHSGSAPTGGVVLQSHSQIMDAVANRQLVERIKRMPGVAAMPPSVQLDDCSIKQIENWINQGMPNN